MQGTGEAAVADVESAVSVGPVVEAGAGELFPVEADPVEGGRQQVEQGEPVGMVGKGVVIVLDFGADQRPELPLVDTEMLLEDDREEPEVPRAQCRQDRVGEVGGGPAPQVPRGGRRQAGLLRPAWPVTIGVGGVDQFYVGSEVLDRYSGRDVVTVEDEDDVLAVRGEGDAVDVQVVQQRRQQAGQQRPQPLPRPVARAGHQLADQRPAVGADEQQRRERPGPFAGGEQALDRLPPQDAQ